MLEKCFCEVYVMFFAKTLHRGSNFILFKLLEYTFTALWAC